MQLEIYVQAIHPIHKTPRPLRHQALPLLVPCISHKNNAPPSRKTGIFVLERDGAEASPDKDLGDWDWANIGDFHIGSPHRFLLVFT